MQGDWLELAVRDRPVSVNSIASRSVLAGGADSKLNFSKPCADRAMSMFQTWSDPSGPIRTHQDPSGPIRTHQDQPVIQGGSSFLACLKPGPSPTSMDSNSFSEPGLGSCTSLDWCNPTLDPNFLTFFSVEGVFSFHDITHVLQNNRRRMMDNV